MGNIKRVLIDRNTLVGKDGLFSKRGCTGNCQHCNLWTEEGCRVILEAPTVDAYTEEQVAQIIKQADKLAAKANELEKEVVWLKSCLNCKIRNVCPRHCGKVVHGCDHWEYGNNAVEVVHGYWVSDKADILFHCSECETQISTDWDYDDLIWNYCPNCGAKMDGDGNE